MNKFSSNDLYLIQLALDHHIEKIKGSIERYNPKIDPPQVKSGLEKELAKNIELVNRVLNMKEY